MAMGGSTKERGREILAWTSFGLAVIGGAALTSTFVGGLVAGVVGFFPSWVAIAGFAGALSAMAMDLFVDGEPNRIALVTAAVLPSLARAVPGKLGLTVTQASAQALAHVNDALGEWLGVRSALGLAVSCIVVAILMSRRVIAKTPSGRR